MAAMKAAERLPVKLSELCLNTTLRCGQSFRWRKSEAGVWSMALHGRILLLQQDQDGVSYRSIIPASTSREQTADDTADLLKHYLNLGPDLTQLYADWSAADRNFAKKAPKFTGVRILKQDAWEALVGFICSSNNNIVRISQMVNKICTQFGQFIGSFEDQEYHDFPSPAALAEAGVEQKLRELGFGYRAKYIYKTACMLVEKDIHWLDSLRNPESPVLGQKPSAAGEWTVEGRQGYREAHEQLLSLQGVGPKVADCVCLMGLGWGEAVPVDTHVWQIAQRDYKFGKGKHSSLTRATYDAIGNKFRALWGQEAGWAHSVLFTADLKAFSDRLVAKNDIKEEDVSTLSIDPNGIAVVERIVADDKALVRDIKREAEEEGMNIVVEDKENVRVPKRRRKR